MNDVACDFCNCDGTSCKGGVLIGTYAVCGCCAEENGYYDEDYENAHEIDRIFDQEKTFEENVHELRKEWYGSDELFINIFPF